MLINSYALADAFPKSSEDLGPYLELPPPWSKTITAEDLIWGGISFLLYTDINAGPG
jgi:hypothetical protein